MDWKIITVIGLYSLAVGVTVYQSRASGWDGRRKLGTAILLVGAAVALFIDELVTAFAVESPIPVSWAEPIGAGIIIIGYMFVRKYNRSGSIFNYGRDVNSNNG